MVHWTGNMHFSALIFKKGLFSLSCFLNIKMGEEKPQLFCFHFKIKWTQQMLRQFLRSVHSLVCTHYIRFNLHCKKENLANAQYWKHFLTLCKLTRQAFLQDKWPKNISVGFSHFKGGLKTIYQKDKNPLTKILE